jgi:hypothetical protein
VYTTVFEGGCTDTTLFADGCTFTTAFADGVAFGGCTGTTAFADGAGAGCTILGDGVPAKAGTGLRLAMRVTAAIIAAPTVVRFVFMGDKKLD